MPLPVPPNPQTPFDDNARARSRRQRFTGKKDQTDQEIVAVGEVMAQEAKALWAELWQRMTAAETALLRTDISAVVENHKLRLIIAKQATKISAQANTITNLRKDLRYLKSRAA